MKTYGPVPADRAAGFDDYLQQVVRPGDYVRRDDAAGVWFDVSATVSPVIDMALESIARGPTASGPALDAALVLQPAPKFHPETRVPVYDSSHRVPWAHQRRRPGVFDSPDWDPFKS